jgi:hypothetical protein
MIEVPVQEQPICPAAPTLFQAVSSKVWISSDVPATTDRDDACNNGLRYTLLSVIWPGCHLHHASCTADLSNQTGTYPCPEPPPDLCSILLGRTPVTHYQRIPGAIDTCCNLQVSRSVRPNESRSINVIPVRITNFQIPWPAGYIAEKITPFDHRRP